LKRSGLTFNDSEGNFVRNCVHDSANVIALLNLASLHLSIASNGSHKHSYLVAQLRLLDWKVISPESPAEHLLPFLFIL